MDDRLGVVLADVGGEIDWPEPSTGFSRRVITRIGYEPVRRPQFRRVAPAFGALAVLVAAVITFSPATRDAVADLLGLGGVSIEYGPERKMPTAAPGEALDLGDPVSLEEAREKADFKVLVPALLGEPDAVYFDAIVASGMVSLVYESTPDLKAAQGTNVGALITEFRGGIAGDQFFKKLLAESTLARVDVNGAEGYWITGAPHSFFYRQKGRVVEETVRLVESVLLWEQDGVTLRIETAGSLDQALKIARSFRS